MCLSFPLLLPLPSHCGEHQPAARPASNLQRNALARPRSSWCGALLPLSFPIRPSRASQQQRQQQLIDFACVSSSGTASGVYRRQGGAALLAGSERRDGCSSFRAVPNWGTPLSAGALHRDNPSMPDGNSGTPWYVSLSGEDILGWVLLGAAHTARAMQEQKAALCRRATPKAPVSPAPGDIAAIMGLCSC